MNARRIVAALLLATVAAALWWTSRPGEVDVDSDAQRSYGGPEPDTFPETAKPTASKPSARRHGDAGALVGSVRVYGTDKPVAGVRVTIASGEVVLGATTRNDGSFEVAGVPGADDWTLTVASDPLGDARLAGVVVLARRTTDVGVVYLAPKFGVPGVVVDEHGAPIAGAAVVVVEQRPHRSFDVPSMVRELPRPVVPMAETRSDADGRFRVTDLPPGTYVVHARKPGFATTVSTSVVVAPTSSLPVRLVMTTGYRVAGRVVRADGVAAADVPVVAFRMSDLGSLFDTGFAKKVLSTTDAEGAFALEGLHAGSWWIFAAPPGEAMRAGDNAVVPRTTFVEIRLDGRASLSGRVTGGGGAAVAGAEVWCETHGTVALTRTDADGRYEMRGLSTGTAIRFLVHADGYCALGAAAFLDPARRQEEFVLKAGANTRDVTLLAGGTVRGVVVEDGTATPVPAATVTVLSGASFLDVAPAATTDDAGRFEITGVPVGAAVVVVKKAGWCQAGAADILALLQSLKPFGTDAKPVEDADFRSGPGLVVAKQDDVVERTIAMTRAVALRGRVIDPTGRPVAGARVKAKVDRPPGVGFGGTLAENAGGGGDPTRLTDAEGRFEIAVPVAAGKVDVAAKAPGFLEGNEYGVAVGGATPPRDVELKLRLGGTIEGRVTDASGAPVAGAAVSWRRGAMFADAAMQAFIDLVDSSDDQGRTTTDADGAYRLTLVNPFMGSVTLDVRDGRHVAARREKLDVRDGKTLRVDVTLASGLSIAGRVSRTDGRPPTNAWVEVHRDDAGEDARDASGDESVTQPDGRFRVDALAPGKYRLVGHARGAADSAPVVVDAGAEGVELRLAPRLPIAGFVKFADGRPAVGGKVTASRADGEGADRVARTDEGGAFRFDEVDPGEYELMAESGSAPTDSNFRGSGLDGVAAGDVDVSIEARPGLTISGEVLGADGAPVASGIVRGTRPDRIIPSESSATIRAGRFELHGLSPGTHVVSVEVRGLVTPPRTVEAGATDVNFRVTKGGTIKGRVLMPDGEPAHATDVSVEDDGAAPAGTSTSPVGVDDHGNFTITVVVAGPHRLTAVYVDYVDNEARYVGEIRDVRVVDGRTTEGVEIRLRKRD